MVAELPLSSMRFQRCARARALTSAVSLYGAGTFVSSFSLVLGVRK